LEHIKWKAEICILIVRPDIRRKLMKQMNGPITKSLVTSAMIFLLIATGSVFSLAEEKTDVSKVVFYVA
jgi:hypothetical protein